MHSTLHLLQLVLMVHVVCLANGANTSFVLTQHELYDGGYSVVSCKLLY